MKIKKTGCIGIGALTLLFSQLALADEAGADDAKKGRSDHGHDINFGGSVDINYRVTDYDEVNKDKGGDLEFNRLALNMDGSIEDIEFSAQYRWYSYQNVVHHAWAGYKFSETSDVKVGINRVPFGVLDYVDNSYWFGPLYYIGLEDDHDMGIKYSYDDGNLNMQFAFYKNEEWGDSSKTERYSLDVIRSGDQQNEESNQLNARIAYKLDHQKNFSTEMGLSLMAGQLYNRTTAENGDRWAAAVHFLGNYNAWTTTLQATRYEYSPENPAGVDNDFIQFAGFATEYFIAAEANVYTVNIARKINVDFGKVKDVSCYSDYTLVEGGTTKEDTQLHVLGCSFGAGPLYTYVDFNRAKNFLFIDGNSIGSQPISDGWQTMFNVNVGYYF